MRLHRTTLAWLWVYVLLCSLTAGFQFDTKVRVTSSSSIHVPPQSDNAVNLEKYMTLPVEQYVLVPMPMNSKLSRQDDHFLLTVPPLQFLSLQVQPFVTAQVQMTPTQVVITSTDCQLQCPDEASYLERVQLNDRFRFVQTTTLTWDESNIFAKAQIKVDVDPPPPFHKLPRRLLQATGNAAMRLSLNFLIVSFLKGLAKDYEHWAQNADYRQARQELSLQQANATCT